LEKVQKQWHKWSGLHTREESSAAIVRAATAAELMANHAIRTEFTARSQFDAEFVNSLLMWANGLADKMRNLLVPLVAADASKKKTMAKLQKLAEAVNKKRNAIAHQGEFCNEQEAIQVINDARAFISGLAQLYAPQFTLKERDAKKASR
jgi:hypothetical protein